jgi:cytidyltransferase-like protein
VATLYIGGTFDLLHPGHIHMFRTCAKLGKVVVSLNTDEFTERYKKRRPVQTLPERAKVVQAVKWVGEVVINTGDEDSRPAILEVMPDFIVHGSDWIGEDLYRQMGLDREFLQKYGIAMLYLDLVPDMSTTVLRRRIDHGEQAGSRH